MQRRLIVDIEFVVSADSVEKLEIVSRLLEKIGCQRTGDRAIGDGLALCRSFVVPHVIDDNIEGIELSLTQTWQDDAKPDDIAGEAFGASIEEVQFPLLSRLQPLGVDRRSLNPLDVGKRIG